MTYASWHGWARSAARRFSSKIGSRIDPGIDPYLLLLFVLGIFALGPLLAPGYFYAAHDGRHSVFYLLGFDEALRDGAWWPRWGAHHTQGYGYPTFLLQAPLSFYAAEFFVLLGAGYTLAARLTWAVGFVFSAWGMYHLVVYWATECTAVEEQESKRAVNTQYSTTDPRCAARNTQLASLAGVVAGLLYTYVPYRLLDIYVRGALAEFFVLLWFPWVFWAFDRLIRRGWTAGWQGRLVTAVLCYAGVLLTHTFAMLVFTPLLVAFVLFLLMATAGAEEQERQVRDRSRRRGLGLWPRTALAAAAGALAVLLAANFIVPLVVEGPLLVQSQFVSDTYDYHRHFVFPGQLLSPFWGFGYSDDPTGANDGMGFQAGAMVLLLGVAALSALWRRREHRLLALFLGLSTLVALFGMTPAAAPLWQVVPMLSIIQFPWRLLALAAFTLSALGGLTALCLALWLGNVGMRNSGLLVLGLLAIYASHPYIQANLQPVEPWREDARAIIYFEQEHPPMIPRTSWVKEDFIDSLLTQDYLAPDYAETGYLARLAILAGQGEVRSVYNRGASTGGVVQADTPVTVQIRVYYFPGWRVTVDGQPVAHRVSDPYGLMEIVVPPGEHRIDARMDGTPARTLGTAISGMVLLTLAGLWLSSRRAARR